MTAPHEMTEQSWKRGLDMTRASIAYRKDVVVDLEQRLAKARRDLDGQVQVLGELRAVAGVTRHHDGQQPPRPEGTVMTDTTTPEDFGTTLLNMVASALNHSTRQRRQLESVVRLIDAGKVADARAFAAAAAGLDRTPPLAQDSIRCAVDAALPRGESYSDGEQGGMG